MPLRPSVCLPPQHILIVQRQLAVLDEELEEFRSALRQYMDCTCAQTGCLQSVHASWGLALLFSLSQISQVKEKLQTRLLIVGVSLFYLSESCSDGLQSVFRFKDTLNQLFPTAVRVLVAWYHQIFHGGASNGGIFSSFSFLCRILYISFCHSPEDALMSKCSFGGVTLMFINDWLRLISPQEKRQNFRTWGSARGHVVQLLMAWLVLPLLHLSLYLFLCFGSISVQRLANESRFILYEFWEHNNVWKKYVLAANLAPFKSSLLNLNSVGQRVQVERRIWEQRGGK